MKSLTQTGPESLNPLFPVTQVQHFGSAILPVMGEGVTVFPQAAITVTILPGSNGTLLSADKIIKSESLLMTAGTEPVVL